MLNIAINENAPVVAKPQIIINSPIETVWRILTSINDWPKWQSAITKAQLKGPIEEGTEFIWNAGGLNFKSKIHTCQPYQFFGWTGKTIGASAIHNWIFRQEGKTTFVFIEESLHGFFPSLLKKKFQKNLEEGLHKSLEELKFASETSLVHIRQ